MTWSELPLVVKAFFVLMAAVGVAFLFDEPKVGLWLSGVCFGFALFGFLDSIGLNSEDGAGRA